MRTSINTSKSAVAGLLLLTIIAGARLNAVAQPRILTPPRNVAVLPGQDAQSVLPGQNAQFRVVASPGPLAYQWGFNGTPLAGATNNSLTVTNVAWTNLGRYDVVVSNSTGATLSTPAWLLLATRWTEFVIFGASDMQGVCGGAPWPAQLANRLGVPLRDNTYGGADSSQVRTLITSYLGTHTLTTNTLIGLSGGGGYMDLLLGTDMEQAASNHLANVRRLVEAGARSFLILKMWPLEQMPGAVAIGPWVTNGLNIRFEALLDEGLENLKAEYPLTVYRPDLFAFWTAIFQNPTAYGFHLPFVYPYTQVYCDGAHSTLAAHTLTAQECYRWLTPPLRIDLAVPTTEGDAVLHWSGGSAPFQLERMTDLRSGQWEPVGPLNFLSEATVKRESSQGFFRALFLGQ